MVGIFTHINHFLIIYLPCLMALISLIKVLSFLGAAQNDAFLFFGPIFISFKSLWIFFKRNLYSGTEIEWSVSESSSAIVFRTIFLVLVTFFEISGIVRAVGILSVVADSSIIGSHSLIGSSSMNFCSVDSIDVYYGSAAALCFLRISMKLRMSEWIDSVSLVIFSWEILISSAM